MLGDAQTQAALAVVRAFFNEVRSGQHLERAADYLAPLVRAHQVRADSPHTIERTPMEYAEHVREMRAVFGDFALELQECVGQGDRVYLRWRQSGVHCGPIAGYLPTGRPLVEVASAVYRVADGRIVEYWIQVDQQGLLSQLARAAD